jgi:hypothetical protein
MYYDLKVKETKSLILFIFVALIMIVSIHVIIESGISCVDSNGCLRSHCKKSMLNGDYKKLVNQYDCNIGKD